MFFNPIGETMNVYNIKRRVVIAGTEKFATGIAFIVDFSKRFKVVNAYQDAELMMKKLKDDKPDVVLTEIDLSGIDGISATRKIREEYPNVEVVIISEMASNELILEAFSSGACGFISKNEEFPSQLTKFLDILDAGGSPVSADVARKIVESYWRNPSSPLTYRETSVLKLISEGNNYVEIGKLLNISPDTSKSHIRNIYKKLNVNSRSQAVQRGISEKLI